MSNSIYCIRAGLYNEQIGARGETTEIKELEAEMYRQAVWKPSNECMGFAGETVSDECMGFSGETIR